MATKNDELKSLLEALHSKIDRLESELGTTRDQLKQVLSNQATFYGRLLLTRKNMIELHEGIRPSMTMNEAKELEEAIIPELHQPATVRRRTH